MAMANDNGNTHEVTPPANVDDGRILLLIAALENQNETLTLDESGWTQVDQVGTAGGSDRVLAVWRKVASSETGNYTVTHTTVVDFWGVMLSYPGVDNTTPEDVAATNNTVNDSNTHTPASISPITDQNWPISVIWKGGGASTAATIPTDSTQRVNQNTGTWVMAIVDQGPQGTGAFQFNDWSGFGASGDSLSITIALKPADEAANVILKDVISVADGSPIQ
jgi:hypothetical protein